MWSQVDRSVATEEAAIADPPPKTPCIPPGRSKEAEAGLRDDVARLAPTFPAAPALAYILIELSVNEDASIPGGVALLVFIERRCEI